MDYIYSSDGSGPAFKLGVGRILYCTALEDVGRKTPVVIIAYAGQNEWLTLRTIPRGDHLAYWHPLEVSYIRARLEKDLEEHLNCSGTGAPEDAEVFPLCAVDQAVRKARLSTERIRKRFEDDGCRTLFTIDPRRGRNT